MPQIYRFAVAIETTQQRTRPPNAVALVEIVTGLALIGEIAVVQRHLRVTNILRCQDDFVMDDVARFLVARLTQATVQQPALCDIRPTALLPLL